LSNNIKTEIEDDEMSGACDSCKEIRYAYKMLNQKPEKKRLLGRNKCR
jgi:hypothetical protein